MYSLVPHYHLVHNHQHELTIPSHAHSITIPAHTHPIQHGIYKGNKASSYDLYVDELKIGTYKENVENLDLIPFLKKDINSNGKILRGNHVIKNSSESDDSCRSVDANSTIYSVSRKRTILERRIYGCI